VRRLCFSKTQASVIYNKPRQDYKSQTGALLYDAGVKLAMHLDDILACNSKAMDARNMLWNLGNDATFELLSAPAGATRFPPTDHRTQRFQRDPTRVKKVLLRHGDAILINIEQVAHGVRVEPSCADADAARLLPGRRMCVSVRPVLVTESPNVAGYVFDDATQQWENPHKKSSWLDLCARSWYVQYPLSPTFRLVGTVSSPRRKCCASSPLARHWRLSSDSRSARALSATAERRRRPQ